MAVLIKIRFEYLIKLQNVIKKIKFISVHLERSLYPEGLDGPTGGGGGEGGGEEADGRQFFSKLKCRKQSNIRKAVDKFFH